MPEQIPTPRTWLFRGIFALEVLGLCLGLVSAILTLLIIGFQLKDWIFGRTCRYEFNLTPTSHLTSPDIEAEFTRRVKAKGYIVFNCQMTREDGKKRYDGWITLKKVTVRDYQLESDLREVMKSFTDKPLELEKADPLP
jgi:hypothetical protein